MKPSFALDFRDGQVTLLHRTSRGWSLVGSTSFDAPDFTEALGYMRSTALGLSPRGITTKLILPNDQILYTAVNAPGPDAAKRKRQIRNGIDGLTPYALDDLAYDWWGTGPQLQVAVIAKETLAEAEAFAVEHRFNPVSFVAVPENGAYLGEPFFGQTAAAASLLTDGEKVERDSDPVTVVPRDYPRAESKAEPVAEPVAEPAPLAEAPAAAQPDAPRSEPPAEPDLAPAAAADPVAAAEPMAAPEPVSPVVEPPAPFEAPAPIAAPEPAAPAIASAATPEPADSRPAARFDLSATEAVESAPEAPMAMDVVADPAIEDDIPPAPAAEIVAAFASRRTAAIAAMNAASGKAGQADAKPAAGASASATPNSGAAPIPSVGPAPSVRPSVPRPSLAKPAAAGRDTLPFPAKGEGRTAARAGKPSGAAVTAPGIQGARRERVVVPMAAAGTALGGEASDAAARRPAKAAIGLGGKSGSVGGKPKFLGVILTALLLLALLAIAMWFSYSATTTDPTGAGAGTPPPASQASATPSAPAGSGTSTTTANSVPAAAPSDQAALAPTGTGPTADQGTVKTAETSGLDVQQPAAQSQPVATAAPSAEPAPNTQMATEGATPAPADPVTQDEIFLASADTPPRTSDPITLPAPAAGADASPAAEPPPPPFGTVYKFDADGRIIPTPEGIITPEGVMLIAGKPKTLPPARPASLTPPAPAPAETATTAGDAASPDATPALATPDLPQDPTLKGKHPKSRPAGLTPPADQQGALQQDLAPGGRYASLRPQARPASLVPPAPPTDTADAGSIAANGLALLTSPKPQSRPSALDAAVNNAAVNDAVQAALKQSAPDAQVATNDPAPEAQAEPEPDTQSAAPNLPTNASVAKQATTKRAINTRKLSLLAVFGTPTTRYAMVMQPNGAVKKVKVGDNVDGGRIAAISENAVQVQSGGRIYTLSLPSG